MATVLERFAGHAASLNEAPLPSDALHHARRCVLDWFAVAIPGYEIGTRIGAAVVPAHYEFWHTTGTVGCFGAAAAASAILRLDATRTAHALANAGTMAAGLQQAFRADCMSKPMHAGHAAEV